MPILPSMSWISKQLLLLLLAHPVRPLGFMQDGHNLTLPKDIESCCIYFSTGKAKSGLRRLYCWFQTRFKFSVNNYNHIQLNLKTNIGISLNIG